MCRGVSGPVHKWVALRRWGVPRRNSSPYFAARRRRKGPRHEHPWLRALAAAARMQTAAVAARWRRRRRAEEGGDECNGGEEHFGAGARRPRMEAAPADTGTSAAPPSLALECECPTRPREPAREREPARSPGFRSGAAARRRPQSVLGGVPIFIIAI